MRLKLRHLSLMFTGLSLVSGIYSYPRCEAVPISSHQASAATQSGPPATTPGAWQIERIAAFPVSVLERAEVIVLGAETFVLNKWSTNSRGVVESKSLTGWHRGKEVEIGSGSGQGLLGPRPAKGITAPLVFRISADGHFEQARILHGRSRLYIDEEHLKPKLNLWVRGKGKVYIWDESGLRVALGPGDTISLGVQTLTATTAELTGVSRSGTAALYFAANKPSSTYGFALHDDRGLRGIVAEDQPVPGMIGATLLSFSGDAVPTDDGGLVLWAKVRQAGKEIKGLFYFSEQLSKALLVEGEPLPGNPGSKVGSKVQIVAARNARTFIAFHDDTHWLCHDGTCTRIEFDQHDGFNSRQGRIEQVEFLSADSAACVMRVGFSSRFDNRFVSSSAERWDAYLFDGSKLMRLSLSKEFDTTVDAVPGGGPFSGVLIRGTRLLRQGSGYVGGEQAKYGAGTYSFLDSAAIEKGLQEVPGFRTSDGKVVSLSRVRAWLGPDDAVVELEDGIYRMRRVRPGSNSHAITGTAVCSCGCNLSHVSDVPASCGTHLTCSVTWPRRSFLRRAS